MRNHAVLRINFHSPEWELKKFHELISNEFPQSESCILSSDTIKNHEKFKDLITKIISNKINIIIGTQLIYQRSQFPVSKNSDNFKY